MKIITNLSILAIILIINSSCGVYTFKQSVAGGVSSIAIPIFDDETVEGGLRENMTEKITQAFSSDNSLRILPESRADAVLRGIIRSYKREAYTYDAAETVSEYIVRIAISVEFIERESGKIIWEDNNMSNWGTYKSDSETDQDGQDRAIEKLAEDILNKTVKGW